MKFTGERVIEGITPERIWSDHISRYRFAADYVYEKIVLDIACGSGYGSRVLKECGAIRVIGIDNSFDAIDYARNRYILDGLDFIMGDILRIDFPDNYFDMVVSFETIEHLKDYKKALSEIRRVLKDNGLLIISSPNRRLTSPGKSINEPPDNKHHCVEFSREEFVSLLSEYFKIMGLYGQRSLHKIFFTPYLKTLFKKYLLGVYSPEAGRSRVVKHRVFYEYRYLVALCVHLKNR
ncbi:class I SAM-dependent methyltransferase [Deltaproteobacteria bacterium]|nr:class I SAM-dependent methyltransferase [Deltaproteobacteria bacterium]